MNENRSAPIRAFLLSLCRRTGKKDHNLRVADSRAAKEFRDWLKKQLRFRVWRRVGETELEDIVQSVTMELVKSGPWNEENIVGSGHELVMRVARNVISDYWTPRFPVWVPRKRPSKVLTKQVVDKPLQPLVVMRVGLEDGVGETISELSEECSQRRMLEALQVVEQCVRRLPEQVRETAEWELERCLNPPDESRDEQARRVGCSEAELEKRVKKLRQHWKDLQYEEFGFVTVRRQGKARGNKKPRAAL